LDQRAGVPFQRLLTLMAISALPAAVVLGLLVALSALTPFQALLSTLAIALLGGALGYGAVARLTSLSQWLRGLAQGLETLPPLVGRDPVIDDMVGAIGQMRRHWQTRQAELAATARWYDSLFDSLPDPLVLLAEGRRVVRMNRAAGTVFGRDVTGRDLAVVLRDPAVIEVTDAALAGGTGCTAEFVLPVPVERHFVAQVEYIGRGAADGTIAILVLHDVTTARRIEQMRADFVANASHELRTPLSTLLGFIETLRGPARDDEEARDRFLGIMFEQASRMARLVNDLLSLSRIELNEHSPPLDHVDLGSIVDIAVAALQPLAAAKSMRIESHIDDRARQVIGQSDELAQTVQNLLDNAVKYGRDGTDVEVAVTVADRLPPVARHLQVGTTVALAVTDRGEGIGREHLPRLTERFYRVDTARSRKLGGTGLGLAIVKHIVSRHRGALHIDSMLGRGSTFTIYLPLVEAGSAAGDKAIGLAG
jgi:two-component system, OmpR family, phosphate regulon sensor histidine kinase PhoR